MTLDELLLEWSYRSKKGYPSLDSPSDISLLTKLLEELDIPSDVILNRITEAPPAALTPGELKKDRIGKTRESHGIRVKVFLDKVENNEEFELMDGSKIIIDKEQSIDAIKALEDYLS